jgi:diadenosine tetraphosphate (Ap4A) HIT family hydrolase
MNNIIATGAYWTVLLANRQVYLGRMVVLLNRSAGSLSELRQEEWQEWYQIIVPALEYAVKNAFGADLCNWACQMNLAYAEQNPKPQVHWHLRPRYSNKVVVLGEVFADNEFGKHYDIILETPGMMIDCPDNVRKEIVLMIQKNLADYPTLILS